MFRTEEQTWDLALRALSDTELVTEVRDAFGELSRTYVQEPYALVNPSLPVLVRGLQRLETWRLVLVLTPWMLARLFSPLEQPSIPVPRGWSAAQRASRRYEVIGPVVSLVVGGSTQRLHINHQRRLGHHLLQPLIQNMQGFESADAVLQAWTDMVGRREQRVAERLGAKKARSGLSRRDLLAGKL